MTAAKDPGHADLVRFSRDGDQFHYLWAARRTLAIPASATTKNAGDHQHKRSRGRVHPAAAYTLWPNQLCDEFARKPLHCDLVPLSFVTGNGDGALMVRTIDTQKVRSCCA